MLSWAVGVYFGGGIMVADFLCGLVCELDARLLSSKEVTKRRGRYLKMSRLPNRDERPVFIIIC